MKKLLFLVMTLVFMSWGQAYADYAFSINGTATGNDGKNYSFGFEGTLTSSNIVDANGFALITGGKLTATGESVAFKGLTFDVAQLSAGATKSPYSGYLRESKRNTNGDDVNYDNLIRPDFVKAGKLLFPDWNTYEGLVLVNSKIVIGLSAFDSGNYVINANNPGQGNVLGWGVKDLENAAVSLTPTPIPAAAWLLGSGLMGLVGIRRKKK